MYTAVLMERMPTETKKYTEQKWQLLNNAGWSSWKLAGVIAQRSGVQVPLLLLADEWNGYINHSRFIPCEIRGSTPISAIA